MRWEGGEGGRARTGAAMRTALPVAGSISLGALHPALNPGERVTAVEMPFWQAV